MGAVSQQSRDAAKVQNLKAQLTEPTYKIQMNDFSRSTGRREIE